MKGREKELLIAIEKVRRTSVLAKENLNTGVIYCITNQNDGKKYYGQTGSYRSVHGKTVKFGAKGRFEEHVRDVLKDRHQCTLHAAMKKYGIDAFDYEIVIVCDLSQLDDYEQFCITYNSTTSDSIGYNKVTTNIKNNRNNPDRTI